MSVPFIFLAFANQADDYLAQLKIERKAIEDTLFDADREGRILLKSEAETSIQDIFKAFDNFRGQVKIFHYAGHANSTSLALDDQQANGKALADLFKEENTLNGIELVFLNGCATYGQVEKLLEVGVKNVIATAVPINDKMASAFSQQFYQSLASGATIREAYQKASAYIKTRQNNLQDTYDFLGEYRHIGSKKSQKERDAIPWSLYLKEDAKPSEWRIPEHPPEKEATGKTIVQNAEKIYNIDKIDTANFS